MPRRDALAVLAKLRGMERDAARLALADARAVLGAAQAAQDAAAEAQRREAGAGGMDYAAWLPAAQRARHRAEDGVLRAGAAAEVARAALVAARTDAEAIETLLEARRVGARRERLRAEQAALDDVPRRLA